MFEEIVFIIFITTFTVISAYSDNFAVYVPRAYVMTIIPIVQWMFARESPEHKMRIRGTWSSMMSVDGIFGSKFLLFSMTFICFTMRETLHDPVVRAIQSILLLIGFFPSMLQPGDDLLFREPLKISCCCNATKLSLCLRRFCEWIHISASVSYAVLMIIFMRYDYIIIPTVICLMMLIAFQITIYLMALSFAANYPRIFFIIQHASLVAETALLLCFTFIPIKSN